MSSGTDTDVPRRERTARVAWLLSFAVPLVVLLVLLLAAQSSNAVTSSPLSSGTAATAPEEEEEEAGEEWEGWEEGEWEEEEELEPPPAEECLLRSAKASAVARHQRLKLTVGYTTYEPVNATIEVRQGAARIGTFKRHLGRSGVLRFTSDLGEKRPKGIAIRIRLSRGAAGCPSRRLVLFPH